jgi:creatinine amidohydrolase
MQRELQKLTWKDISNLVPGEIDTAIFPVGTVEAHGAAALGTDNLIPQSIAGHLADKIDALIVPVLNYGITRSLYGYPGSITIRPDHFQNFVFDILKSLHHTGFKKVFILNGHGGNNSILKAAAQDFFRECRVRIAVIHWWQLCGDLAEEFFGEAGAHGGLDETAMVQAIDESYVNRSQYDEDMAYWFRPGADIYPVPGSILLYKEGEGLPDFDANKAAQFQKKIFEKIEEFVKLILARWEKI